MTGIVVDDGAVVATAATVMVVVMTAEEAMAVVVGSDGECAGGEGGGSMASGGWRQRGDTEAGCRFAASLFFPGKHTTKPRDIVPGRRFKRMTKLAGRCPVPQRWHKTSFGRRGTPHGTLSRAPKIV